MGATWPLLAALPALPGAIVSGDAVSITQGSGGYSINTSLVENLTAQPWASLVSPELLGLSTLAGEPVVVRAADPDAFLRLEGGSWVGPAPASPPFAVLGTVGFEDEQGRALGVRQPFRLTCVAVVRDGRWRLRHFHGSVPQS